MDEIDGNPICHEEKLDKEEDVDDNAEMVPVEEEDGSSQSREEHGIESPLRQPEDFVAGLETRGEADVVGVDFHSDGPIHEPRNGMEFETKEAAYAFYREYARSVGFGITIKTSRRSKKSGKFIDVKLACSRFGTRRESDAALNPRTCLKTDCKAGLHMKRKEEGIWVIHSFVKEHNHEVCLDDFFQSVKGMNKHLRGIARPRKGLQLALTEEDIEMMLESFACMQDENPNFFYAIDLDHGKRLRNVLWIDPRGCHDYNSFNDVVFFDTFYVSNKYQIPFLPIVGVNNHVQFILLGSALIGNQTAATYSWVMQTWLRAVGGKSPAVIITDQDKCLENAVTEVFPESRHCFCLWHVLRKMQEQLGYIIEKHENFQKEFDACVHQSFTADQFESQWEKFVLKYELSEDDWISSLYEDRRKWVPAYMQDVSLAGFSTVARSGSIVTFFDNYIGRETVIKDFMEKCKTYSRERYEMDAETHNELHKKQLSSKSLSPLEKQMSTIYTSAIFKQFQDDFGVESCHLQRNSEDEATGIFRVEESGLDQSFTLHYNDKPLEICCSCRSFEYRGFLCRHAMLVLHTLGVSSIPSRYILKRWTKDAKITQSSHDEPSSHSSRLQRFNDLCKRAIKLGQEGSLCQEAYDVAYRALQEALEHCVEVNNSAKSTEPASTAAQGSISAGEENMLGQTFKTKRKYKKRKAQID